MATESFLKDKFVLNKKASKKMALYLNDPDKIQSSSVVKDDDYKDIIKYMGIISGHMIGFFPFILYYIDGCT